MALPHDSEIQMGLLRLLADAQDGSMYCADVYRALAEQFPELTEDEVTIRYRNAVSHWANRVQFARLHLVKQGWLLPPYVAGDRGFWTITRAGRQWLLEMAQIAEKMLEELDQSHHTHSSLGL